VAVGIVLGQMAGLVARLLLASAYRSPMSAGDVVIFLVAPVPILAAALVACYWPARRAAAVDPNVALRDL
jgi:putative ABC transport system permease protein